MRIKRVISGLIILFGVSAIVYAIHSALAAKVSYSGPGVHGNLIALEVAKARWGVAHTNDWPTMQDVSPYLTNGITSFLNIQQVRKEIYIINKIGTPVIAYDPRTETISIVKSNDYLWILQEDKE